MANWLIISYRVPTEPSALRVASWRALKQAGAVKLGDGVYFLPNTPMCAKVLDDLASRIRAGGGSALSMAADGLGGDDDAFLIEAFDDARIDEFGQVARSCLKLIDHIAREEATDDYRYAEVDTLEEELEKVRRHFQRAVDRDHLGSASREAAAAAVSDAAQRLRTYVDEAFRHENGLPERQPSEFRSKRPAGPARPERASAVQRSPN
ncbi:MAG: Chromate resistance protein ChrB [Tepidiformaceae bacterium]